MDATYLLGFILIGLVCFIVGFVAGRRSALRAGPMIMQPSPLHMSRPMGAPQGATLAGEMEDVRACIRGGNKIQAIKIYRERTGLGLKESKDAVEAMEREMQRR